MGCTILIEMEAQRISSFPEFQKIGNDELMRKISTKITAALAHKCYKTLPVDIAKKVISSI